MGKVVVVCVVVATGIFGRVVPYVFCLYPMPRVGKVGCWFATMPPLKLLNPPSLEIMA